MATLDSYKIKGNKILLNFSSFIFTKTVELDFTKDKNKIQKLINIATIALGKNNNHTLEFYYDNNNIEVSRIMLKTIIEEISEKIN